MSVAAQFTSVRGVVIQVLFTLDLLKNFPDGKRLYFHPDFRLMSRALDELEVSKLAQVERAGRERVVSFIESPKAVWHYRGKPC